MATHIVKQGEYLMRIAKTYGFHDWHVIYDHQNNADLRSKRPNPDVLRPGDEIYIPDKETKIESRAADKRHEFQMPRRHPRLIVTIKDSMSNVAKQVPYRLKLDDDTIIDGLTDGDGTLKQDIGVWIEEAELWVPQVGLHAVLRIGHLDPVVEPDSDAVITGVQSRLNNLGYPCGEEDGVFGEKTRAALKYFQSDAMGRNDPDGEPDEETLNRLKEEHGS